MELILASQSPRRQELMKLIGIPFTVRVADIDETLEDLSPELAVAQLSRKKAEAARHSPAETVIGADTVVVLDGKILGKPTDETDAFRMLRFLSGRCHQVMTGLTVLRGNRTVSVTEVTEVRFRSLTDGEILQYIASGDPKDKAGSYGIQSGGALFVEGINGDYYNVMGLPVCRLSQILKEFTEETL